MNRNFEFFKIKRSILNPPTQKYLDMLHSKAYTVLKYTNTNDAESVFKEGLSNWPELLKWELGIFWERQGKYSDFAL